MKNLPTKKEQNHLALKKTKSLLSLSDKLLNSNLSLKSVDFAY